MWLGSSVIRVLAQCARRPGFESRSGYVLFSPVTLVARGVRAWGVNSKETILSVPSGFGTNLNHKINEPPHDKTNKMT